MSKAEEVELDRVLEHDAEAAFARVTAGLAVIRDARLLQST